MAEEMSPGLTALTALMQEQNNISNEGGKTIKQVVDEARRANELQKAANAQSKNNADKEEKTDGTPADAGGVTDDATGEPVTDEFNASTASGTQIISQIQQMLVDGGFAPAEQPSGVNKGQPFADGQFGNLTYKALLRARKDQKIA